MEKKEVSIKKVIYQSATYMIAEGEYTDEKGEIAKITLVGNFIAKKGERLVVEGETVFNPKYGIQFKVQKYQKSEKMTMEEIVTYLQEFKSVGATRAKKIVDAFGTETLSVILNNHQYLEKIGIPKNVAYEIYADVSKMETMDALIHFLGKTGISLHSIQKIYSEYGSNAVELIKKNPYILYNRLHLLSFSDCDVLAKGLSFKKDDLARIEALIIKVIEDYATNGNCYMHIDDLVSSVTAKINLNPSENGLIVSRIISMIKERRLVFEEDGAIYLPMYYYAERYSARKLRILIDEPAAYQLNKTPEEILSEIEKGGVAYAPEQKEAILKGLSSKVMVLTGGPGTGKTTTVNGILKAFMLNDPNSKLVLAAPTGKAAKRMEEATKMHAKTIHRLLEYKPYGNILECKRNAENPIDADIVVVDEFSMVDILLFEKFLNALSPSTKLICVGDVDQLPSVGAGNVLADIIDSKVITTVRLKTIFRQAAESPIVSNAYKINSSCMPITNDTDFTFDQLDTDEEVCKKIVDDYVAQWKKCENKSDVQILTPMKKSTICGSRHLNNLIQDRVNPCVNGREVKISVKDIDYHYRIGDRVIQTKNNYEKGCFNGDTGYIKDIETTSNKEKIVVTFDNGMEIEFVGREEILEIELAYALTIHKSQGSEYKHIYVPVVNSHKKMLAKNLLYTGVTRAKQTVHLYGQESALKMGVENVNTTIRLSKLKEKIL